jgi:hypothetical protein
MSKARQIHYDALALAVDAFGSVKDLNDDDGTRAARRRLRKAALATIAVTREVATDANDAALLVECDRAQQQVEAQETPGG